MTKKITIIITIIILILLTFSLVSTAMTRVLFPRNYDDIVRRYAEKYNVDENLIFAIIRAESRFRSEAVSHKGAKGLMQLMEATAIELMERLEIEFEGNIEEVLFTPEINIHLGVKYIANLIEKYQNIEVALAAYNAGRGTVDGWIENGVIQADGSDIENIPFKETNMYVRRVMRDYRIYRDFL